MKGCHVSHPQCRSHRSSASGHLCLQTNLSLPKVPLGYIHPFRNRRVHPAIATMALGRRGNVLLSPYCYLWVPHHRVSGQRASRGIGSVSQFSLNKERSGGSESTVNGSEHAEAPQRSACKVSQGGEGKREHAQRVLGACQWTGASGKDGVLNYGVLGWL